MGGVLHPEEQEDFQVRVGQEELGRILNLRHSLEHSDLLSHYLDRYRDLGWVVEPSGEGVEGLDFRHSPAEWAEHLTNLALSGIEPDLLVKTGAASGLLVLVTPTGDSLLDTYGEWRSPCLAVTEDHWEQHYFHLPPGSRQPLCRHLEEFHIRVFGHKGWVPVPPSRRKEKGPRWTWVSPPWETPPPPPPATVWEFLEDFGLLAEPPQTEGILPWEEVYPRIAYHEDLMRALLTPAPSITAYYRELAHQALLAGIREPEILLSLLWHAPQGDARTSPERLPYLKGLVMTATQSGIPQSFPGRTAMAPVPPGGATSLSVPSPVNELVEFMENRVILDRRHYESMVFELAELTAKTQELQRRLEEWERRFGSALPPQDPEPTGMGLAPRAAAHQKGLVPPIRKEEAPRKSGQEHFQCLLREFLLDHEDLAEDPEGVHMLQFCLRNYIELNPELNALSLRRKLELAAQMAREFLQQIGSRGERDPQPKNKRKDHGVKGSIARSGKGRQE